MASNDHDQVVTAVGIVFGGISGLNQQTQEANQFLTQFQHSPQAWQLCLHLLQSHQPTLPSFYAAQTLRNKLKYDLHQLPSPQSLHELRPNLLQILQAFSTQPPTQGSSIHQITTQLSLCVAVLSIQLPWFSVTSDILSSPLPPSSQLKILKSIAEESFRGGREYKQAIGEQFNVVTDFCYNVILKGGADAEEGMNVLKAWVRYIDCGVTAMTIPSTNNTHQLPNWLTHCLEILANPPPPSFESSIDVVVEVLRKYESEDPRNTNLVMKLIPELMALQSPFLQTTDEDAILGYCRVFTEMGESFMSLLLDPSQLNQISLVSLVLQCAMVEDKGTACITMNFWYRFVGGLEQLEPYEFRQGKVDYYYELLMRLTDVCCGLLVLPEGVETEEDMDDDVKSNRSYTADTVEDCCRLLGGDSVVIQIGKRLQQICGGGANPPWQEIEACLYAVKSIARYIPRDEETVIPHVMNMVTSFAANPQSQPSILRHTSAALIGKYADWIGAHPSYLEGFFNYLLSNLRDPACSQASSSAIKHLCESCGPELSGPVVNLYDQLAGSGIAIQDELQILEGVCKLMSKMSYEDAGATLQRVMTPVGGQLEMVVSGAPTTPKVVNGVLQRLTVICQHANPKRTANQPNLVLSLMQQCWPMLTKFVQMYGTSGDMAENVSRLFKYALRNCKREFAPLLEPLMQLLTAAFDHTFQSPYLYCSAICITEFANVQDQSQSLYNLIVTQSQSVFKRFTNIEAFTNHPDVVEEYFYLLSRFIKYCPALLFKGGDLLCQTLKCAVVGLQVRSERRQ
ncbi:hypothetical protein TL16_g01502 [Triparma laevis f. inornata]|uniref:Importin N-terminal domain-containing protein n=1 Tax=Triparma laevis f. inornata TaxID=1714386 RepID=A0A9W6ZK40_9STRA|nr:hypothetical protein TL16_g01502 [Triparma laevis f. inornata]